LLKTDPYLKGCALLSVPEYLESLGGDAAAMMAAAGLPTEDFDAPEMLVSMRGFSTLLETAARQFRKPDFGLQWLLTMPPHLPPFYQFILLAKFEKDCRSWLQSVISHLMFYSNSFQYKLIEPANSPTAILRYTADPLCQLSRQFNEIALAQVLIVVRSVTQRSDLNPVIVRFQHAAIQDETVSASLAACFACPVEFNADHNEIIFDKSILSISTQGNLSLFKTLVNFHVRRQIARMPVFQATNTIRVRLAIASALGTPHCNIEDIADSFDMTTKQLQRLLQGEETNFSEIYDKVRESTACSLLLHSDISVGRIAGMLDYTGAPPFNLAFRRWTGQSPLEFRKRGNTEVLS
jgi:AraC-like DNA-binding protein